MMSERSSGTARPTRRLVGRACPTLTHCVLKNACATKTLARNSAQANPGTALTPCQCGRASKERGPTSWSGGPLMFKNTFRPTLEELNARDVPSAGGIVPPPSVSAPVQVLAPAHHPLVGLTNGNYSQTNSAAAGASIELSGPITLAGLGTFQMTGSLHGAGPAEGRATGQLILTNQYGSLTVDLHS